MKRVIGVVTGARSEYGVLRPLLRAIAADPALTLRLYVTAGHLSKRFGLTVREIEKDGFRIAARVPTLGARMETAQDASKAVARGVEGFSRLFAKARPDLLLVMSDRYEMLPPALAAMFHKIVVAHLSGGKITQGAMDESVRHALTKLSHYHFTHSPENRARLIRMGEQPSRVFATGSPLLDEVVGAPRLGRAETLKAAGLPDMDRFLIALYHPETLGATPVAAQMREFLGALKKIDMPKALFYPGADVGSEGVIAAVDAFAREKGVSVVKNIPRPVFLNLLRHCAVLVGNSSAGITDTPTFGVPVVDVGDRQKGMVRARNVVAAPCRAEAIVRAVRKAAAPAFRRRLTGLKNPYGDGRAAARIVRELKRLPLGPEALRKPFFDGP